VTDKLTVERVAELRALRAAATKGWLRTADTEDGLSVYGPTHKYVAGFDYAEDRSFYVALHNAAPALLDAAESEARLRGENEALANQGAELLIAYHAAICSPAGIVPIDKFYDPAIADRVQRGLLDARAAVGDKPATRA